MKKADKDRRERTDAWEETKETWNDLHSSLVISIAIWLTYLCWKCLYVFAYVCLYICVSETILIGIKKKIGWQGYNLLILSHVHGFPGHWPPVLVTLLEKNNQ